jgi:hypothetical protein
MLFQFFGNPVSLCCAHHGSDRMGDWLKWDDSIISGYYNYFFL